MYDLDYRGLVFLLFAVFIASCGAVGSGSVSCTPSPKISSSPPRVATVGHRYLYAYKASYNCGISICNSADARTLPAGAVIDDYSDTITWTPTSKFVNRSVDFSIETEDDACGKSKKQSWSVDVHPAPVIKKFSVNHRVVNKGDGIKLYPKFSQGRGHITGLGKVSSGDYIKLSNLKGSVKYKLVVTNDVGHSISQTISVEVLKPPVIKLFESSEEIIKSGESTSLSWSISGDYTKVTLNSVEKVDVTGRSFWTVSPTQTTIYTLSARNQLGNRVKASLEVKVLPAPVITNFIANPGSTTFQGSVLLQANFDDADGELYVETEDGFEFLMPMQSGMLVDSGPLYRNQRFQLLVTNQHDITVAETITVPISGPQTFQTTDIPNSGNWGRGAVRLLNGEIFIAGGLFEQTVIFDPITETHRAGPVLVGGNSPDYKPRRSFGMALMADGRVLIAGGNYSQFYSPNMTAEIYDPVSNSTTATTPLPDYAATVRNAVLLADGRVLLYYESIPDSGAVLFDPLTESYTDAAPMNSRHDRPRIHLLDDGRIAFFDGGYPWHTEIYDPASNSFQLVGKMIASRHGFVSARLRDGTVLIAGGGPDSAEKFNPVTGLFTAVNDPIDASSGTMGVTLNDGRVLLAGGYRSEIYDPATGKFTQTGGAIYTRYESGSGASAILLEDGRVLLFGTCRGNGDCSSEIYSP